MAAAPSWLPVGAAVPTPANLREAVAGLDADTWTETYTHLAAHRRLLTTAEAHAELIATAEPDDLPLYLALLELFTAGMPGDELEQITTEGQSALDFVMQTLTDRQTELASRALNACPDLAEGPQGKALKLAIDLVDQNPRGACRDAQTLTASPEAPRIAAEFAAVAEAFSGVLDASDVAAVRAILGAR